MTTKGKAIGSANDAIPSLKKRAAKGAVWITIEMMGVQATSFAVFVAMAHYVEPRDFGLISVSFLVIQSLQMLFLWNITTVVARKQEGTALEYTTTFWISLGVAATLSILVFALSGTLERVFDASGLAPVLKAMSVTLLFLGLARTHEIWLTRHFQFQRLAVRGFAGALVGGIVGLVLATQGFGVMALVGQQAATSIASLVLLWTSCPWRPNFCFCTRTASDIFRFLRSITPNSTVTTINQNCDTFLVAFFLGPIAAGLFNVGKRIRLVLQLVTGAPISGMALSMLAEVQHDHERLRRGVLRSLTLISLISAPVFLGASAVSQDAINVMFGSKWENAAPVLALLSLGGLAATLLNYNDNIFILLNRQILSFYISLTYATLAVVFFVLLSRLKISSMALPFVIPYLIILPMSFILVSKLIHISPRELVSAMLPGLVAATLMFIAVKMSAHQLAEVNAIVRLAISCAVGALSYCVVVLIVWRNAAKMLFEVILHMVGK